jgi:hypothetical protein
MMDWVQRCLVCGEAITKKACTSCGAVPAQVEETLRTSAPFAIPTFWRYLRDPGVLVPSESNAIWQDLKDDFKESLIREYRVAQFRSSARGTLLMFPLIVILFGSCFCSGLLVARWLGIVVGKEQEWLSGVAGTLALFPLRVLPLGGIVEERLRRSGNHADSQRILDRVSLIGPSLQAKCRIPWYFDPGLLIPTALFSILAIGWFVL